MLRSTIHRAVWTGKELDYEGSLGLDRRLRDAADRRPGEVNLEVEDMMRFMNFKFSVF
jgi:aspartate 1-decarboxylase